MDNTTGLLQKKCVKSFVLSHEDTQDKNEWILRIKELA